MYKKGLTFILATMFVLMLSTASFASIQLNPVNAGDITIIEPQIGTERQVFIKDSMAISIRSEGDYPVYVSLYKVMPSAHNAYLDDACTSEMVVMADEIPFRVISGGSIVARDSAKESFEGGTDAEKPNEDPENTSSDSGSIINGSEALLQKDKLSSGERQDVIKAYKKARSAFEDKLEDLEESYEAYMNVFEDGHEEGHEYSESELEIIEAYLIDVEETKALCDNYTLAKKAYGAIFEVPLFGPEDLTDTGILPYYQKTVEKISPGLYKFEFTESQSKDIIDVIEFEIIKNEELTEEDIKDAMPSNVGELILPAKGSDDDSTDSKAESSSENDETLKTDESDSDNSSSDEDSQTGAKKSGE
ncbi:hypothetical protein [Fusibacter sp. JL216-2]|uniref:hypothetical protein n=1 Tax=Fusibacter sp. JL216-2 TaxID=3071453 RepID=UPI003D3412BB